MPPKKTVADSTSKSTEPNSETTVTKSTTNKIKIAATNKIEVNIQNKIEESQPESKPKASKPKAKPLAEQYVSEQLYSLQEINKAGLASRFRVSPNYKGSAENAVCSPKDKSAEKAAEKAGLKPIEKRSQTNFVVRHEPAQTITANKFLKNTEKAKK